MKVRFMGLDCAQLFPNTYDAVLSYLRGADLTTANRATALYSDVNFAAPRGDPTGVDSAQQALDLFTSPALAGSASDAGFRAARQDARVIVQYAQYARLSLAAPVGVETINDRDACMAENTAWLEETSPGGVAVCAHDSHVSQDADYWGMPVAPMGEILHRAYGARYQIVGFSFVQGTFNVDGGIRGVDGAHLKGSYNETFAMVDLPSFAIDLRGIPPGDAWSWFAGPRGFLSVGSVYSPERRMAMYALCALPNDFDVLVHVQRSTPTHEIPRRPWMG